jgi:hypothetical protein
MDYIVGGGSYPAMVGGMSIPGLLFPDSLDVGLFSVNGLQNGAYQVEKKVANLLREKLYKRGLGYSWHDQKDNSEERMCKN